MLSALKKIFRREKELPPATEPVHYPYLVAGCGRSGTHFLAKYLQLNGIDVGHETPSTEGVVGWIYGAEGFCQDRLTTFDHKGHIIRHPLLAVRSLQTINDRAWRYIDRYLPVCTHDNKIAFAMRYWVHWNKMCMDGAAFSVRLEDYSGDAPEANAKLKAFFGRDCNAALIPDAREHGDSRKKRGDYAHQLTLDDLRAADAETYVLMEQLAAQFGYDMDSAA